VAVVDSPAAQTVLDALSDGQRFDVAVFDADTCSLRLRTGKADLVVVTRKPDGALEGSATANPATQRIAYEYRLDLTRTASVLARNAVDDALQRAAGRIDSFRSADVEVDEPGARYIDFLVPGMLGLGLMGGGLWGVGFVTVDMRIRKLLKRFVATPMKRSHFLAGIMISRMVFTVTEVMLVLVFAWLVFGVVIYGSLLAVVLLVLLGAVTFSGIGLLVASRAETIETVSGLMNAVMVPMWIGSGVFFRWDRFPEALHPLIRVLPLTPLIDALRAVMLEGATLASQAGQIAVLVAWAVVSFTLALWWFRWT
jgi:ABC-type multidrug transport system permease subunit